MIPIEHILLIGSLLILLSIGLARVSDNLGVPTLLLFLAIGMLAGSEGPGGIYFDDASLAQSVGIIALVFILFAGGLDTNWRDSKPIFKEAAALATIGVLFTAVAVGLFVTVFSGFSLLTGLLLGAIVSSTDAAAVFAVLRSRNISLHGRLKPFLEFESGSNDPMAVLLTVAAIQLITAPQSSFYSIAFLFVSQMGLGAILGFVFGKILVMALNRFKIQYEGMYLVLILAFAMLTYGATALSGGSGFLAVYVAGLVAGNRDFVQKKSALRFFDGLAWLSQITMFLTLGLLVFPSRILPVLGTGLACSAFLMFVARPASVFLTLSLSRLGWRAKTLVSWVGLRGAVPIILATFPLIAGIPEAEMIFNVVFFIVLTSALLQGSSIPFVARLLRLQAPIAQRRKYPIEFAPLEGVDTELVDLFIPFGGAASEKSIVELGLPKDSLIVLLSRGDRYIVPSGGTVLEEGDVVLVLVNRDNLAEVRSRLTKLTKDEG
jgi:cell volume regulation protein A